MSASLDELLQQALTLSDDSRLLLAEELVASVNASPDVASELIERRRAEVRAGTAALVPSEDAVRQVREALAAQQRGG